MTFVRIFRTFVCFESNHKKNQTTDIWVLLFFVFFLSTPSSSLVEFALCVDVFPAFITHFCFCSLPALLYSVVYICLHWKGVDFPSIQTLSWLLKEELRSFISIGFLQWHFLNAWQCAIESENGALPFSGCKPLSCTICHFRRIQLWLILTCIVLQWSSGTCQHLSLLSNSGCQPLQFPTALSDGFIGF